MARVSPQQSIASILMDAGDALRNATRQPNINVYRPHEKQKIFHSSTEHTRLYIGGNRSGKTFGSVAEDIWWALGTHPYRQTPEPPVRGRVVGVDILQGINQILIPIFKQLIPPSGLIDGSWEKSYSKSERTLTFANGSTIEFMSYEMDLEKFAGTSRHFIHFDEEPPLAIYNENQMRLIDTDGSSWISMTPVEGITWVFDKLYKPANEDHAKRMIIEAGQDRGAAFVSAANEIAVIEVDIRENPYLSESAIKRILSNLEDEELAARRGGKFVEMGGLVFKQFKPETHVISASEFIRPPEDWQVYTSTDHGWNNPTAWLWHAVSPDGDIVTFAEHYATEMTIAEHAQVVHALEAELGITDVIRTGDPAMRQTSGITGTSIIQEYADNDLFIGVEGIPRDVATGIAKMQQYFRVPDSGRPKWVITDRCPNLVRELRGLRWKTYTSKKMQYENNKREEIHKKDDHAADSARYFATLMPDLAPDVVESPTMLPTMSSTSGKRLRYDEALLQNARESSEGGWKVRTAVDLADIY